jgi:hypothetical protein
MRWSAETVVPAARSEGLVVEHLAGETLIYDPERDEAHHLNRTAAVVFELCDGRTTLAQVAGQAVQRVGEPLSTETVFQAVEQLATRGLLASALQVDSGVSRRELVRKAALVGAGTAAAAPLIKSIVAPTPAQAASQQCLQNGEFGCTTDQDCCQDEVGPGDTHLQCFNGQCLFPV